MKLYRFRSIDALLDKYHELENQTIYFASPEELNDPMEGFRDIVWSGDRIVWTNFFKHFVYCLHVSILQLTIHRGSKELGVDNIPILGSWYQLPTPKAQTLFDEIWHRFLNLPNIPEIIEALSNTNRKIRYRELGLYFRFIHSVLLDEIEESYIVHGLISESTTPRPPGGLLTVQDKLDLIFLSITEMNESQSEERANAVFQSTEVRNDELRVALQLKNPNPPGIFRKNIQLVIYDFPKIYLEGLERLLWPKWYTACFMEDYHNSSVWAHYGGQHRGICLIFEPKKTLDNSNTLNLHEVADNNAKAMSFHEISYRDKPGEVDFFPSIGNLSPAALMKWWYTDEEGNQSEFANQFRSGIDLDDWRKKYWDRFFRDITIKTKDWEYEREYRLILAENLSKLDEKEKRTLTYNFNSLKGVVFGIKTSDENRLRIIEIIQRKCRENNRTDFKFYQAYYSSENGDIRKHEVQVDVTLKRLNLPD